MNLIDRLEEAMNSDYIQENPDKVIELLVEATVTIKRTTVNMNAFKLGMIRMRERADNSIKEFAEKLEEKLANNMDISCVGYQSVIADINDIVEGMVGEFYVK